MQPANKPSKKDKLTHAMEVVAKRMAFIDQIMPALFDSKSVSSTIDEKNGFATAFEALEESMSRQEGCDGCWRLLEGIRDDSDTCRICVRKPNRGDYYEKPQRQRRTRKTKKGTQP